MDSNKSKKPVIVMIIILVVLIIALTVLKLYHKSSNNEQTPNNEQATHEETEIDEEEIKKVKCEFEDLNGSILDFPTQNDSSVKESKKTINGTESSDTYTEVTYKHNDYTVIFSNHEESTGIDYVEIKNSDNQTVYLNENLKININGTICDGDENLPGKNITAFPIIKDGKLYFVSISNVCYGKGEWPYYSYQYIDLNSDASKPIKIQYMKIKPDYADFLPECESHE